MTDRQALYFLGVMANNGLKIGTEEYNDVKKYWAQVQHAIEKLEMYEEVAAEQNIKIVDLSNFIETVKKYNEKV